MRIGRMHRRGLKNVPFFPLIPLVPLALIVGTFATAVRALIRVRHLERMITAPTPS